MDDIGGYNCKCKLGFTGIQFNVYMSVFFGTEKSIIKAQNSCGMM